MYIISEDKTLKIPLRSPKPTNKMMFPSSTFLFLFILTLLSQFTRQACPIRNIEPCNCKETKDGVQVECSQASNGEEIAFPFKNALWPSTQLSTFKLTDNNAIETIPEDVFADYSFKKIWMEKTAIRKIHPSAILPSKDHLEYLDISRGRLEEFPFNLLPRLPRLKFLNLYSNSLTVIPALNSPSLEYFSISDNMVTRVKEFGWKTPNLIYLSMSEEE
ncbi:unnamed protein product [Darwinula stevensoni]|uniref:Uncharacterized protein n=1 Tax=Darwinula stevensoni TaxID=69355 RepID=A0A7R9ACW3_9CRUS|nr:unnamed protein product [Darwinula stevensoni]CAG0900739.1 unnamed protein product [Darwinula stevensoni]